MVKCPFVGFDDVKLLLFSVFSKISGLLFATFGNYDGHGSHDEHDAQCTLRGDMLREDDDAHSHSASERAVGNRADPSEHAQYHPCGMISCPCMATPAISGRQPIVST